MNVIVAAIVLVGATCLLDLLLTYGVIRRLRDHGSALERMHGGAGNRRAGTPPGLRAGETVRDFTTTAVDGELISRDRLLSPSVVTFLAADCTPCHDRMPELVTWARRQDRRRVLVVIDGLMADPVEMVAALTPVAQVVVETEGRPVIAAFKVTLFPVSYVLGEGGEITSVALELAELPSVTLS